MILSSITPAEAYSSDKNVKFVINGSGFKPGVQVKLKNSGQSINATNLIITNSQILGCFDFSQMIKPGMYDVVVTNPDQTQNILPNAFILKGYLMSGNQLIPVNSLYKPGEGGFLSIKWSLEKIENVSIKIYNTRGEIIKVITDNQNCLPQAYHYDWDGTADGRKKISSGIYFIKMVAGSFVITRKIVIVR